MSHSCSSVVKGFCFELYLGQTLFDCSQCRLCQKQTSDQVHLLVFKLVDGHKQGPRLH